MLFQLSGQCLRVPGSERAASFSADCTPPATSPHVAFHWAHKLSEGEEEPVPALSKKGGGNAVLERAGC